MSMMGGVTAGMDLEVGALIKVNDRYFPVDDHSPAPTIAAIIPRPRTPSSRPQNTTIIPQLYG